MSANKKKPYAMILAGYDKFDLMTKRKHKKEIREAYGEDIFLGENKFLYILDGKPIIQYVIDSVYNAKKNGRRIYDKIYIYNDIKSLSSAMDISKYDNLVLRQMTDSVAGHWKDIYGLIEYGQRVDVFFGDTPRVTSEDVEYIYDEFGKILGKERDHRGVLIHNIYNIVESTDLTDNWLEHRIRRIKYGKNKGKLKHFVGFKDFQARVGNAGTFLKHPSLDDIIEHKPLNFLYNIRKALTPSSFSHIMYHLWKAKKFNLIMQIKNRRIDTIPYHDTVIEIIEYLYKIDLSNYGGMIFHVKKNASHWENDIDGPADLMAFQKKFNEIKGKHK
ncbi:MAG: hypothetical protein LBT84_02595 [Spirochaetia bacterium]|jgi:molybdopterin-guanine dinucleotide biosynthesis protein A|nr:hypothetical protein [Spirochaetia bacterium]